MLYKITISVSSGHGGNGIVNGRKEKFIPYGGPDAVSYTHLTLPTIYSV